MKRIPVEDYGVMKDGHNLEVHQSLQILSYFRDYNDMNKAFELFIPKKVLKENDELEDEDKDVIKKLFYRKMIDSQRKVKTYRRSDL